MIQPLVFAAIAGVLVAWVIVALALRHWGPGARKRSVKCPEKERLAYLTVAYAEPDFGAVRAADVLACSLFDGAPVGCDKRCLSHL